MTHIAVKGLPAVVQCALESVGYGRKDISVTAQETVTMGIASGDGYRAFVGVVNLDTGERKFHWGSWGGANAYCLDNRVDNDREQYAIPVNGCVILGSEGGGRPVSASIVVRADALAPMLPPPVEVTEDEKRILYAYRALKGGAYRKEYLSKIKDSAELVNGLVARGLLKRAKNDATSITTEGRNAVGSANYY